MKKLYIQGVEKMSQEFDIINILKALRNEEEQIIDLDSEAANVDESAPANN